MSKTMFISDTSCDLPKELLSEHDVDILADTVVIDGKPFIEGSDFTNDNFYEIMPNRDKIKYSGVAPAIYINRYMQAEKNGYENAVVLAINSDFSPIFASATEAKEIYRQNYPDSKLNIEVVDSGTYSMGTGLILLDAIKAANEGKSLDEIMSVIEDSKKGITILINSFSVRNLPTDNAFEWMKKALIEFDHPFPTFRIIDGTAEEIEIKKGNHTAFDQFYAYCLEALNNEKPQYAVGYASRSKEARATALLLEEELGYPPVALFETGVFTTYVTGTAGILLVFRDKTNIE